MTALDQAALAAAIDVVFRPDFAVELARCTAAQIVLDAAADGASLFARIVDLATAQADACAADPDMRWILPDPG